MARAPPPAPYTLDLSRSHSISSSTINSTPERLDKNLATVATEQAVIEVLAKEISDGIQNAVSLWMSQITDALQDPHLTTLGRLYAIQQIVSRYHQTEGSRDSHDRYAA